MRHAAVCMAILMLVTLASFASIGIGVKLVNGNTFCVTGELGGERLSVELDIGLRSVNVPGVFNWTMIWVSGVARLAFPMGSFAPYVGLGGIGVNINLDSAEGRGSLNAFGITGEGGLRYSLEEIGFPLHLSVGPNISWIPVAGEVENIGIGGVGLGWHIGATLPF